MKKEDPNNTVGTSAPKKRKDGSEKRSTANRLTKDQWDELLLKLMSGKYTQRQLAREYEVSVQSIINKRRKTDTKIGDVAPQNKTIENAKKEAQSSNVATRLSLEDSGKLIADAKLITFERIDMLGKLTGDLLKKAWLGGNIQGIGKDIKVLLDVQTMFEKEIRLKGICLGFPEGQFGIDESSLTVLTVNRMSDEEVQQAQDSLDDDDEWGDDCIESGDEEDEEG